MLADNPDKALANSFGRGIPRNLLLKIPPLDYCHENGATIFLESSWALNTLEVGEAITTLCGTLGGADMRDGLRINARNTASTLLKNRS